MSEKVYHSCGNCGEKVYRAPSQDKSSKSGKVFCSRSCSTAYNNQFKIGDKHPNWTNSHRTYRTKAFKYKEKVCEVCGYNKYPEILEVHHIDGDRRNNELSNLQIVCPTCHAEIHFKEKSGKWSNNIESVV